jgi:hypothetical protein
MLTHIAAEAAHAAISALPGTLAGAFWRYMLGRLRHRRHAAHGAPAVIVISLPPHGQGRGGPAPLVLVIREGGTDRG